MTVGGDGGIMVTNDESIAERVRSLRDCGRAKGSKYTHDMLGFTERLNTVQAAVGRVQLKRLDDWNGKRRKIASEYNNSLSDLGEVVAPPPDGSLVSQVYHMYAIRPNRRDELREWLSSRGVETGVHYTAPIHLQPIYRQMFGYKGGEFPNSETLCNSELSIPMHPSLTSEDVEFIVRAIHDFYKGRNRTEVAT
jgi:dTDP-4-amino-4,6-dideoxygalactose transaminase